MRKSRISGSLWPDVKLEGVVRHDDADWNSVSFSGLRCQYVLRAPLAEYILLQSWPTVGTTVPARLWLRYAMMLAYVGWVLPDTVVQTVA